MAAVAGVNPASITNGAPTAAATTNPLADIMGLINHFATNNIPVDGVTFIMSPANALALSFRTNLDGSPQFPGVGINGGSYRGLTFITSERRRDATSSPLQPALHPLRRRRRRDDRRVARSLAADGQRAGVAGRCDDRLRLALADQHASALRAERFVNWKRVERERGQVPDGDGLAGADRRDAVDDGERRARGKNARRVARAPMRLFGLRHHAAPHVAGRRRRRPARRGAAGFRSSANPTPAPGSRTARSRRRRRSPTSPSTAASR